jgi:hypothetical protein
VIRLYTSVPQAFHHLNDPTEIPSCSTLEAYPQSVCLTCFHSRKENAKTEKDRQSTSEPSCAYPRSVDYRAEATFKIISNAEPLSEEEMERRMDAFRLDLGPANRAQGKPDILVATMYLSADSDDAARAFAAERLQHALDDAGLYGIFQTRVLEVSEV